MTFDGTDTRYTNADRNTLLPVDTETKKKVANTLHTWYERLKALLVAIHAVST